MHAAVVAKNPGHSVRVLFFNYLCQWLCGTLWVLGWTSISHQSYLPGPPKPPRFIRVSLCPGDTVKTQQKPLFLSICRNEVDWILSTANNGWHVISIYDSCCFLRPIWSVLARASEMQEPLRLWLFLNIQSDNVGHHLKSGPSGNQKHHEESGKWEIKNMKRLAWFVKEEIFIPKSKYSWNWWKWWIRELNHMTAVDIFIFKRFPYFRYHDNTNLNNMNR